MPIGIMPLPGYNKKRATAGYSTVRRTGMLRMDANRWLRPNVRVMMLTTATVVGGLWLLLAVSTGYAAVWWPEHRILHSTVATRLGGTAMLSSFLASPFVFLWLWMRRVAWRVGPEGIAVYRGDRLMRSLAWEEITTLHVLPCYAVLRSPLKHLR